MSDHQRHYIYIENRVAEWAANRPDIQGVLVVGSRARHDKPADEFSDLDLVVFADDPDKLVESDAWLAEIGTVVFSFVESTAVGSWRERRAVFAPMLDVDFSVVPSSLLDVDFSVPGPVSDIVRPVIDRGYRIVHDPDGRLSALDSLAISPGTIWKLPAEATFTNIVVDFWYHAMWTTKKLRRGEIVVARNCLDSYMKGKLLQVINWHAHIGNPDLDTWHGSRFFEQWTDEDIVRSFHATFGAANHEQIESDLKRTMDLFSAVARDVAKRLGYDYPELAETHVRGWIQASVPDTLS